MKIAAAAMNSEVENVRKFQNLLCALGVESDAAVVPCTNSDVDVLASMLTAAKRAEGQEKVWADFEARDSVHFPLPPMQAAPIRIGQDEFVAAAKSAQRKSLPRIAAACAALTMGLFAAIGALGTANVAAESRDAATRQR